MLIFVKVCMGSNVCFSCEWVKHEHIYNIRYWLGQTWIQKAVWWGQCFQSKTLRPIGVVERSLCIHSRSYSSLISKDSFESGSFWPNCRTWSFTLPKPLWSSVLKCRPTLCVELCWVMYRKCSHIRSLSVRLVCPMYCLWHTWQVIQYMILLVLQLQHLIVLYLRPVMGLRIEPEQSNLRQYLQLGFLQIFLLYVLEGLLFDTTSSGLTTSAFTRRSLMFLGLLKPWVTFQSRTSLVLEDLSKMSQLLLTMSPRIRPLGWYVVIRNRLSFWSSSSTGCFGCNRVFLSRW